MVVVTASLLRLEKALLNAWKSVPVCYVNRKLHFALICLTYP